MTTPATPRVSIGMPVFNSQALVRRALESVLAQDFADFELIISDGASNDDTVAICREYAARDARITVHASAERLWPLANFGRVLDAARGEYFMWAAHDDYRDPNYLSALLDRLPPGGPHDLCCARFVKVNVAGQANSTHPFPEVTNAGRLDRAQTLMRHSGAPWVYGLYRTSRLRAVYGRVKAMRLVWFWDHLVILHYLLADTLTGTNDTTIYQVKTGFSSQVFAPKTRRSELKFAARVLFQVARILLDTKMAMGDRIRLAPALWHYTDAQVFHWRRSLVGQSLANARARWRTGRRSHQP